MSSQQQQQNDNNSNRRPPSAISRLQQELKEMMLGGGGGASSTSNSNSNSNSNGGGLEGISAFPESDNIFKWCATIHGGADPKSPYAGLEFSLVIQFPADYPFSPPQVNFVTPCFHPNVSGDRGEICLDILKENWSAVLSVSSVLLSIQSLLLTPNVHSPLNPEAAQMWIRMKDTSSSPSLGEAAGPAAAGAAESYRSKVLMWHKQA